MYIFDIMRDNPEPLHKLSQWGPVIYKINNNKKKQSIKLEIYSYNQRTKHFHVFT